VTASLAGRNTAWSRGRSAHRDPHPPRPRGRTPWPGCLPNGPTSGSHDSALLEEPRADAGAGVFSPRERSKDSVHGFLAPLRGDSVTCCRPGCGSELAPSRRGEPRRFCSDACRLAFHATARKLGTEALRRQLARQTLNPPKVAAIVAWAEGRRTADLAAWGIRYAVEGAAESASGRLSREAPMPSESARPGRFDDHLQPPRLTNAHQAGPIASEGFGDGRHQEIVEK
jgi:hypothetical protein